MLQQVSYLRQSRSKSFSIEVCPAGPESAGVCPGRRLAVRCCKLLALRNSPPSLLHRTVFVAPGQM